MTRSELYALVWAVPTSVLAKRLGMSDVGLAKLCRRHDIPVPGRGYWAKLAAGGTPHVDALPPRDADEVVPRFRDFDAEGNRLPPGADSLSGRLPGLALATRQRTAAPTAEASAPDCRPSMLAPDQVTPPSAQTTLEPLSRRRSRASKAGEVAAAGAVPVSSSAQQSRQPDWNAALDAATEHAQRRALRELLARVEVRASEESIEVQRAVLTWVDAMRKRMEQDDPVSRLVGSLRSAVADRTTGEAW